jgi:putative FmdB family regulatory protein
MPTYEYKCLCCDKEFEVEQSIKSLPSAECPQCKVTTTKRLISGGTTFTLKGGGWAADTYSSKS